MKASNYFGRRFELNTTVKSSSYANIIVTNPRYSLKAIHDMFCDCITKSSLQISPLELHTLINRSLCFKYFL